MVNFLAKIFIKDYQNIESEKGIITQEIHMCDDNPTDVLYEYIRKNSF